VTIQKDQFETFDDGLLVRAPAKINLSLLVDGKRSDGFHEIRTVMAKVNWYDELLIERSKESGIELICNGRWSPAGQDNLVYKACKLLCEFAGIRPALRITLTKNVPAGAGLGSGSSDAAAALLGLNRLLGLALGEEKLGNMAAQLGSDIPFFLGDPLALCSGRGERVEKIERIFRFFAIVVLPNVSVCTKEIYENCRHRPAEYQALEARINQYIEKNRIDLIANLCANMMFESCLQLHQELAELKARIEVSGVGSVCMTGSGSALYVLFDRTEEQKAKLLHKTLTQNIDCESIIVNNNRW